jgi:hypothetical protein
VTVQTPFTERVSGLPIHVLVEKVALGKYFKIGGVFKVN